MRKFIISDNRWKTMIDFLIKNIDLSGEELDKIVDLKHGEKLELEKTFVVERVKED